MDTRFDILEYLDEDELQQRCSCSCPCSFNGGRPIATAAHRRLRLPLTLIALGVATALGLGGSLAAWTAQTTNPGSSVTAGTLDLTNSKEAAAVFSASNVVPGDTGQDTVTITNDGTVPMTVLLSQDQLTATGIEASLGLKVYDQTRNHCYWPLDQPGACPAAYGAWDATASLTSLPVAASDGSPQWPAGEAHTFTISWELAATSPNSDQGKTGSFRFTWDATP